MTTHLKRWVGAALLTAAVGGCTDFLESKSAITDPNQPTQATRDQLFVAMQATQFGQQEASVAQFACVILQQCAGNGNFLEGFNNTYATGATTFNLDFNQVYTGGGLLDLRKIQESAEKDNDKVYAGVARVWEALAISFGADNWGDIPYTKTAEQATPDYDKQAAVYDSLQLLLDRAIQDLDGGGAGPGAVDFVYGGNKVQWKEAAYTLKARLYMHTAEAGGAPAYQAAIAAASKGISKPENDFLAKHGSATLERNMWFQFANSTFGQYLKAGKTLVELMKARGETVRLTGETAYYSQIAPGQYAGIDQNGNGPAVVSEVATIPSSTRIKDTFRQPILTYDETQLILAEAKNQAAGGVAAAQPHLDNVRLRYALPVVPATLQNIAEEEYVSYFQNIEAWQSYKRTCWPNLTPATAGAGKMIPARLYYGSTETNANPNTPDEGEQNAKGGVGKIDKGASSTGSTASPRHNPNDPPGGTVTRALGVACVGQP